MQCHKTFRNTADIASPITSHLRFTICLDLAYWFRSQTCTFHFSETHTRMIFGWKVYRCYWMVCDNTRDPIHPFRPLVQDRVNSMHFMNDSFGAVAYSIMEKTRSIFYFFWITFFESLIFFHFLHFGSQHPAQHTCVLCFYFFIPVTSRVRCERFMKFTSGQREAHTRESISESCTIRIQFTFNYSALHCAGGICMASICGMVVCGMVAYLQNDLQLRRVCHPESHFTWHMF